MGLYNGSMELFQNLNRTNIESSILKSFLRANSLLPHSIQNCHQQIPLRPLTSTKSDSYETKHSHLERITLNPIPINFKSYETRFKDQIN